MSLRGFLDRDKYLIRSLGIISVGVLLSFYLALNWYLKSQTQNMISAWISSEAVSIQENQILSTFSKTQRLLGQSKFIVGISVFDTDRLNANRPMFETGVVGADVSLEELPSSGTVTKASGFFKYITFVRLNSRLVAVFWSEWPFAWMEFLGFSLFVLILVAMMAAISAHQARIRAEIENRSRIQLGEFAARVAHDIGSPLTVLRLTLKNVSFGSEEQKNLFAEAVERISTTAQELLFQTRIQSKVISKEQKYSLEEILRKIEAEKRIEFSNLNNEVDMSFVCSSSAKDHTPPISSNDFKRILSNLVNNAIQARVPERTALIKVQAEAIGQQLIITVSDNCKGIPDKIKVQLGSQQISYDKVDGTGLGLLSTRESVLSAKGKMEILSKVGVGTQIRLSFPASS
jgi:signal transduction histidine kinase